MGWHLPVFFAGSPDQPQPEGCLHPYRATISAVSKNVPVRARPACRSTTSELTRSTRVKPVLRRSADRYHRRGHLYPRKRWGLGRSHQKRSPFGGCSFPPSRKRDGHPEWSFCDQFVAIKCKKEGAVGQVPSFLCAIL